MSKIINFNAHKNKTSRIEGEKIGRVSIDVYKDNLTQLPFFHVQSENENVLQVSYVIEDTLYKFKD